VRSSALVDERLDLASAAQPTVAFGITAFVRDDSHGAGHDGKGGQELALEQHRIVHVRRRRPADHRNAIAG
jgi:hypothetical protein